MKQLRISRSYRDFNIDSMEFSITDASVTCIGVGGYQPPAARSDSSDLGEILISS
jgi:hypothetical protein